MGVFFMLIAIYIFRAYAKVFKGFVGEQPGACSILPVDKAQFVVGYIFKAPDIKRISFGNN